ncbi:MAG: hypothetical protein RI894_320 [Bacteroidota bacterium]|jgi:hypothetical protein
MKQNYFLPLFCAIFFCTATFTSNTLSAQASLLREQLTTVNAEWTKQGATLANSKALIFANDDALIQAHLQAVEQYLRTKNTAALTPQQAAARTTSLDELKRYWQQKRFPRNTYHAERTPYFIDKYGTACAVGQLIIASGNVAIAEKIRIENNYAYIADLAKAYPELLEWATKNGFELAELAWIQPTYPCANPTPCNGGQVSHPSCANSGDGCIGLPAVLNDTSVHFPITYNLWVKRDTTWVGDYQIIVGGLFNGCLNPGEYKWTVTDANGTVHHYPSRILVAQNQPITLSVTKTTDTGTCNGTATANLSNPIAASYYWYPSQQTAQIARNLCAGTHSVVVSYTDICGSTGTSVIAYFQIETATATANTADNTAIKISPNPANTHIYISQAIESKGTAIFSDIWGRNLKTTAFQSNTSLDVSYLPKGMYFIHVKTAETASTHRLLIE